MIDFEKLKLLYKFGRELNLSDVQVLLNEAKRKRYESGDHLLKMGGLRRDIFLIRKGLLRFYTIKSNGEEITTSLHWENQIVANTDLLFHKTESRFFLQALEATEVLYMDYDKLQDIINSHPKLERHRKNIFQKIFKTMTGRLETFILLSPEERYLAYIDENPDIINRVQNKYLANVLGITPVSLSRIRKRVADRRK